MARLRETLIFAVLCTAVVAEPVAGLPGDVGPEPAPATAGAPQALSVAPDGSIYVLSGGVARYGVDGEPDTSFAAAIPRAEELWHEIHALSDGVIVVGSLTTPEGLATSDGFAVRLRSDGRRDPSFGDGGRVVFDEEAPEASTVDRAGRLLVGRSDRITRLLPTGDPDPTFGDGGRVDLSASGPYGLGILHALADGSVLLAGSRTTSSADAMVARLTPTGDLDRTYGDDGVTFFGIGPRSASVVSTAALDDGSLVVSSRIPGVATNGLARVSADGDTWTSASQTVRCGSEVLDWLTPAPDGRVLARVYGADGGSFALTRLNADLGVDRTFGTYGTTVPGDGRILGLAVQRQQDRAVVLEDAGDRGRLHFVELGTSTAVRTPTGADGYWIVGDRGGVFSFGDVPFCGSAFDGGSARFVGAAESKVPYGYWMVTDTGTVEARGAARHFGSVTSRLNAPVLTVIGRPQADGYWVVAHDGGVFSFGAATFHGSTGNIRLNQPIVGAAPTPTGNGYWIVARDGGVFSFGDAAFHGSTGAMRLNQPVVAMEPTATGRGYWLVASDGGVFTFGDATFFGSTGAIRLARPLIGIDATGTGLGYRLVARDGGIFGFGDARYHGSLPALVQRGTPVAEAAVAVVH